MKNTYDKSFKDDQKTALWLKKYGISNKQFKELDIWKLQASIAAQDLFKNHAEKLTFIEERFIRNFCFSALSDRKLEFVTQKIAYQVLNLNKKIKRKKYQVIKNLKKSNRNKNSKRQAPTNS
jgi:hypothetical protein